MPTYCKKSKSLYIPFRKKALDLSDKLRDIYEVKYVFVLNFGQFVIRSCKN